MAEGLRWASGASRTSACEEIAGLEVNAAGGRGVGDVDVGNVELGGF